MEIAIQVLINGLLIGGVFALISIGLTLIFGVMKIINFAHGEFLMLAMYAAYFLSLWGVNPYVAIVIICPVFYLVGAVAYKFVVDPVINASELAQLLSTLGLAIFLQNAALFFFSGTMRSLDISVRSIELGGLVISKSRLIAFVIALIVTLALFEFLNRTWPGKAIRATAMDKQVALLMGIDVSKAYLMAFAIGTATVGIAGAVLAPMFSTYPMVGAQFGLVSFVIVVLGGVGDFKGAFLGGLIIGLIDSVSGYLLTTGSKEAVYFVIFLLVLVVRPSGLMGLFSNLRGTGAKL